MSGLGATAWVFEVPHGKPLTGSCDMMTQVSLADTALESWWLIGIPRTMQRMPLLRNKSFRGQLEPNELISVCVSIWKLRRISLYLQSKTEQIVYFNFSSLSEPMSVLKTPSP